MYLVMLVVSMLLPMRVSAQTVKGKLVDESNHPLPYANVDAHDRAPPAPF